MKKEKIKEIVKEGYAKIAQQGKTCCAPASACCGSPKLAENISKNIGYTEEEIKSVPDGANLGLGCGNPTAAAVLKEGEVVLDLGSGAGFDCFLASLEVGPKGKVIGVDMTPEMIEKAKENAEKGDYKNVEFRLGDIESLPVSDNSVDITISNCVINLSLDKKKVFKEVFRATKPGGRMMISDLVLVKGLPDFIKDSVEGYIGCLSGAIMKDEYMKAVKEAGFKDVKIIEEKYFPIDFMLNDATVKTLINSLKIPPEKLKEVGKSVVSIKVSGVKPR